MAEKWYLIDTLASNRIGQAEDVDPTDPEKEPFKVAPDYKWVKAPEGMTHRSHTFDGSTFAERPPPPPKPVVPVDTTPGTWDVIDALIAAGIVTKEQLIAVKPEWTSDLNSARNLG